MTISEGFQFAVTNMSICSPGLWRPRLGALQAAGVSGLRDHPLRARWADQSAWVDEIFRLTAAGFDASADLRLQGLRGAQERAGAGL